MIKAIIFDLGGIIIYPNWEKINEESIKKTGISIYKPKGLENKHEDLKKDLTTTEEYFKILIQVSKKEHSIKNLIKLYKRLYKKYTKVDKNVLSLVKDLSKKFITICLSDTVLVQYKVNEKRGILKHFKHKFFSFGLNQLKKENSFIKVLESLKLKPEECLFIDDAPRFVEGAERVGIKGLLYTSAEELEQQLIDFSLIKV